MCLGFQFFCRQRDLFSIEVWKEDGLYTQVNSKVGRKAGLKAAFEFTWVLINRSSQMKRSFKIAVSVLLFLAIVAGIGFYMGTHNIPVLDPKGMIAAKQRDLLIASTLIMLIVVVPVIIMTLVFAWKYRESNQKATQKRLS